MKTSMAIFAAALALALTGCGGNDAATGSGESDTGTATASEEKGAGDTATASHPKPRFPTPATQGDPHFPAISYEGKGRQNEPTIEPSDLPPPKRLLVKDLRVGTGPVAYRDDEVVIWYIDFNYKTGKDSFFHWRSLPSPYVLGGLGTGMTFAAMEEGIEGMRVGGRRVMLVPAHRGFGSGALVVFVDLVGIKR
ncbi:MAG TPA: hypothetical protein VFR04_00295 [Solirubrobacterales bacterium]|nr:hypothetical protein [Solirubrobacterales bacterium]